MAYRLARADLEALVSVAVTTAPRLIKRRLHGRDPQEAEAAHRTLVARICDRVDNDSSMVVVADMVRSAHHARRGRWDLDEPVPAKIKQGCFQEDAQ